MISIICNISVGFQKFVMKVSKNTYNTQIFCFHQQDKNQLYTAMLYWCLVTRNRWFPFCTHLV